MISENLKLVWEDTTPFVFARHPEWVFDAVLGEVLEPSNAVVVSGFWRSGTTWLLESISKSIGAKPVFEPLKPDTTGYKAHVEGNYFGKKEAVDGYMPFCYESLSKYPLLDRHSVRSLTGAVPGVFVRAVRHSVRGREGSSPGEVFRTIASRLRDSLRMRVATKFTRAHLILPLLQSEFDPVLIHIQRDPRAVVESLFRQDWAGWVNSMSLEDYLLHSKDGRQRVFSQWTEEIRSCDHSGRTAQIAGYWALVEWYLEKFGKGKEIVLSFEQMVKGGRKYINKRLSSVPGVEISEGELSDESRTSDGQKSEYDRVFGWKEKMRSKKIKEVESTVKMFEMGHNMKG